MRLSPLLFLVFLSVSFAASGQEPAAAPAPAKVQEAPEAKPAAAPAGKPVAAKPEIAKPVPTKTPDAKPAPAATPEAPKPASARLEVAKPDPAEAKTPAADADKPAAAPAAPAKGGTPDNPEAALNERSVLLFPILQFNDATQLWEEDNSWRKSWKHVALQIGRGQIIVPYGDRRDREEINAEESLTSEYKDFVAIAERYGVKEIYIATAEYQSTDLSLGVQVHLRKLSPSGMTEEHLKFAAEERETREQQLERVAMELARRLTKIKGVATDMYQTSRDNEFQLRVRHDGFKEFNKIRVMLEAIPSVRRVRIDSLSYYNTNITLLYRTSPELLGKSFAAQGFRIYKKDNALELALP